METEAECKSSSQQPDLDEVLEKINEIAKESATGDYIYRGEPAHHEEPPYYGRVTSSLYRQYLDIEAENFDVAVVQADILRAAHEYTPHKMDDFELLATLQHFGDKTNLIDFTTDYLVALFFACNVEPEKPGRIILLQREPEVDPKPYEVKKPPRTILRAETQKSIFVQAPTGFVELDGIVTIPTHLKAALLDYLRKHHDISTKTIYNDLHGFIENRGLHKSGYTEFYEGLTCQERADATEDPAEKQKWYDKAIAHYTTSIELNPELTEAYYNKGNAYYHKSELDKAIQNYTTAIHLNSEYAEAYHNRGVAYSDKGELDKAIQNYDKAIELNREYTSAYYNRGKVRLHLKEWKKAKEDLTIAKEMEFDLIASFHNGYESVEDFEAKHGVKVPEDIAALLRQS